MWGNVQRGDDMLNINFDFSKRSDWIPLFNNKVSAPSTTIQQKLCHKVSNTQDLEFRLEKKLRKKLANLRKLNRTIWNHHISNIFKNSMAQFELSEMNGRSNFDVLELRSFLTTNKVNGVLLNVPYTNIKSIVNFVQSLNIHLIDEPDCEFALAVTLHAYPNNVFAVWIVYTSIVTK